MAAGAAAICAGFSELPHDAKIAAPNIKMPGFIELSFIADFIE
jgi:hypothetical protein